MTRYEAAERMAYAVFSQGWGALFDSELEVLSHDAELKSIVEALIQKLHRAAYLERDDKSKATSSPHLFDHHVEQAWSIEWKDIHTIRLAELWVHKKTKKAVLEIREWSNEMIHSPRAINIGAHKLILQQKFEYKTHNDLFQTIQSILASYGCNQTISEISQEFSL